jgi:hypothetical protein
LSFLIDTNVISELAKGPRCNPNVRTWYAGIDAEDIFLSVLVLGEIRKGVERARRNDPVKAQTLERWLSEVRREFAGRILTVDEDVAEAWGRMSADRTLKAIDSLLAATAKSRDLTLVTRNVADVLGLGAVVLDPFSLLSSEEHPDR